MSIKELQVTFVCDNCGKEAKESPLCCCPRVVGWRQTDIKDPDFGFLNRHYCSYECEKAALGYEALPPSNISHKSHLELPEQMKASDYNGFWK